VAELWLSEFNPQEAANTAWASATANHRDEKPFAALSVVAERWLSEFNPQHVANTAWAFAAVNFRDERLFAAQPTAAVRRLRHGHSQRPTICLKIVRMGIGMGISFICTFEVGAVWLSQRQDG